MYSLLTVFRRYFFTGIFTFIVAATLAIGVIFLIPDEYRSEATILVKNANSSLNGVNEEALGYADRRIEVLTKQVLSRDNISKLAHKFDLAEDIEFLSDGSLSGTTLKAIRDKIKVSLDKVRAADPKYRFEVESAVALKISFAAASPETAQAVTKHLVELFLRKNNEGVVASDGVTTNILKAEIIDLEARLKSAEDELKTFKEANVFTLPEMKESNMRVLENTEAEIAETRAELQAAQEKRIYLESELIRLKPFAISFDADGNRVLGPEDRLKTLQAELATKSAKYSSQHPDIVKLEREILSLESSIGGYESTGALRAALIDKRTEATELRQTYSDTHPTLASLDNEIRSLERVLSTPQRPVPDTVRQADNPAYISTAAGLKSTKLEVRELGSRLTKLEQKQTDYENRVARSPLVEREFNALDVNYQRLLDEYKLLREKTFSAKLASSLNEVNFEQGLTLLEPANLPERPDKPKRTLLGLLGLILAAWAAIGAILLRHKTDDRIWISKHLDKAAGSPPLIVVLPKH